MKKKCFYDLDGTLSKLNNTFDFVFYYLKDTNKMKYYYGKAIIKIINKIKFIDEVKKRKLLISILFKSIKKEDLEKFFEEKYKSIFIKNLTKFGKNALKNKKNKDVLLTGCTEIPANQIAKIFNFKKTICTTFKYENDKIKGIDEDTYANLKLNYVNKNKNDYFIYYNDDSKSEKELEKIMDDIKIVSD